MQGGSGGAGLQAADLAAAADLLIVQQGEMADLSGESRLAVVEPPFQDHAHAEAPAQVDGQHVAGVLAVSAGEIFRIGHGAGVVLDGDGDVEILLKNGVQRQVVAHEVTHGITFLGIDPPGQADTHAEHLFPRDAGLRDGLLDHTAEGLERLGVGFQDERDVGNEGDDVSLEIGDGDVEMLTGDVHADEIPCIGVEAEDAGTASARGADLAQVQHEAFVDQLADDFRDRGDAGIELFGQVRNRITLIEDAEAEDFPLHVSILAVGRKEGFSVHGNRCVSSSAQDTK